MPLEIEMVRFIDNFSKGHRGAISAEKYLENGYAVVFLYRSRSLRPYCRLLEDHLFDYLCLGNERAEGVMEGENIQIKPEHKEEIAAAYKLHNKARSR